MLDKWKVWRLEGRIEENISEFWENVMQIVSKVVKELTMTDYIHRYRRKVRVKR
ncbi:hypothetical protein MNL76_09440 [Fervidobacterium riparium]